MFCTCKVWRPAERGGWEGRTARRTGRAQAQLPHGLCWQDAHLCTTGHRCGQDARVQPLRGLRLDPRQVAAEGAGSQVGAKVCHNLPAVGWVGWRSEGRAHWAAWAVQHDGKRRPCRTLQVSPQPDHRLTCTFEHPSNSPLAHRTPDPSPTPSQPQPPTTLPTSSSGVRKPTDGYSRSSATPSKATPSS